MKRKKVGIGDTMIKWKIYLCQNGKAILFVKLEIFFETLGFQIFLNSGLKFWIPVKKSVLRDEDFYDSNIKPFLSSYFWRYPGV